jgi:hypothetical protein
LQQRSRYQLILLRDIVSSDVRKLEKIDADDYFIVLAQEDKRARRKRKYKKKLVRG